MAEEAPALQPIGAEQIKKLTETLQKYKAGKSATERRVVSSENWWKMRNSEEQRGLSTIDQAQYRSTSGWLHNVITSKHADAMEAYPEPNILPREQEDRAEALMLSSIIPCVLEQTGFEQVSGPQQV